MSNEILLYSPIFDFTAESFINQLNDLDGEDVTVRINSPGGSVFAGWGMVAKSKEYAGNIKIKVDGNASSMAAIFLLFHKNVEALNVSKFTLHRASVFGQISDQDKKMLDQINADIRKAFESKLNVEEFEKVAGVSMDDFFNSEEVIDVDINATQAKKIGLISKINKLEAEAFAQLNKKFAAFSTKEVAALNQSNNFKNKKAMTIDQLKAEHPAVYAQVLELGQSNGIKAERDRAGSWLAFGDVDFPSVAKGIKDGEKLSQTAMAELSRKSFSAKSLKDAEAESEEEIETTQEETIEPTAMDTFMEEFKTLKIK